MREPLESEQVRSGRQLLGIVPARGGSKGVPRKNMRLLGGRPLIAHTVDSVIDSGVVDRLVISSDDAEILAWAELHGHEVDERPAELATDEATIADVTRYVAAKLDWSEDIGVFQPTSPFRSAEAIARAVALFRRTNALSLASAVREPHLFWFDDNDDLSKARPLFEQRTNRQYARHKVVRETGAIQLVRGEVLLATGLMVTDRHLLFETTPHESIDINSLDDLADARRRFERETVVFRLRANALIGSGHLHHCLQLAEELDDNNLRFLLYDCDRFVEELIFERGYTYKIETDLAKDLQELAGSGENLIVNDVLDTQEEEVLIQKTAGYKVVNIEDLGAGTRFADWVVNALYPIDDAIPAAVAWGARYATLRSEFHGLPEKSIRTRPERVLITFGGTDPGRLGERCADLLSRNIEADIRVVIGPGSQAGDFPPAVTVVRNVTSMAAEMMASDIVLTSAGRTVYEAAATGTPVVVLAQNAREATHAHLTFGQGTVFLGVGQLVDDARIVEAVVRLLNDVRLRTELSERLRSSIDFKGAERIASGIRSLLKGF